MTFKEYNELKYWDNVGKAAYKWVYGEKKTSKEWQEKNMNVYRFVNRQMLHYGADVYEQIKSIKKYELKYQE